MSLPLSWQLHALEPADGLGPHRADWDRLHRELAAGHAMLDGDFVDGLLRHFGAGGVWLAVARSDGKPVAMLLLNARGRRLGVWSSFMPAQTQIGPCLLPPGIDLGGLLAALPGYASELDLLCNDPQFGDLRQLPERPVRSQPHALTMSIAMRSGFDEYWAQRPRKLIQNMRRYVRRLHSEGQERLVILTAPEAMPAAVARYAELESAGWKGREGTAVRMHQPQGRFYGDVMRQFAARGEARVYELWLGDRLLASRMLLARGPMVVMLKTTYDEQAERFAPGRILLLRTLEDLFKRMPGGVIEFYTDAQPDLLAWSTSQRWINHVSVYRHRGLPEFFSLLRRGQRRLRRQPRRDVDAAAMAGRSGATVEWFRRPRELPEEARALMRRREDDGVEFGADWFDLLADTVFVPPADAQLLVLRRQGRTLAVLPVARPAGTGGRAAPGARRGTRLYAPALEDDLIAEDLLPLMLALRRSHRAPAYHLCPLEAQSRELQLMRGALRLAGLRPCGDAAPGRWHLRVDGGPPPHGAVSAAAAGVRLQILRDEADVDGGIAAYEAVRTAVARTPDPQAQLLSGLIRLGARRGWLRLGVAWRGDAPVAVQLWIVNAGRARIHLQAQRAADAAAALAAHLLQQAIDVDGVADVEAATDAGRPAWMTQRRERLGLVAFDPATARGLYGLLRAAAAQAGRRLRALRSTPALPADNPAS